MHQYRGKLIVHTGSMFSGKTSSLWKDLNRFRIAKYDVLAFKPAVDVRHADDVIKTHDDNEMDCIAVQNMAELVAMASQQPADVIGIDEVQFLPDPPQEVIAALEEMLAQDRTVVVAGLDMDFQGRPFEIVKELMPVADYLNKHHAVCAGCGVDAWISHRKTQSEDRVVIGAQQEYEPLCRKCYAVKEKARLARKNQITLSETMEE